MRRPWLLALLLPALGCGPSLSAARRDLPRSPYRVIAVAPFAPAPDDPGSGPLVTRLFEEALRDFGFSIAASSAEARGLLTGEVIELSDTLVTHPARYEERVRTYTDAAGKEQPFIDRVLVKPEWIEGQFVFRVRARLSDLRTGGTIWEGSTWVGPRRLTREAAASSGVDNLLRKLVKAVGPLAPAGGP